MPSYPHRIRLRGPWQREAAAGTVRFRRRFNRPTGLDPHERVWLVVEGAQPSAIVALNERRLGEVRGYGLVGQFDVTGSLAERNEVVLDIELPSVEPGAAPPQPGGGLLGDSEMGDVRLEVRSSAFLDRLALLARDDGGSAVLELSGRVAGEPVGEPVEVVTRGLDRELLYGEVRIGDEFSLSQPVPDLPAWSPGRTGTAPLARIEVALLRIGTRLWESTLLTARRTIEWTSETRRLMVAGVELALSQARTEQPCDVRALAARLAKGDWPKMALLAAPLDRPCYELLDRNSRAVLQLLPVEWSGELCPRLAHHPSIVAWTDLTTGIAQLADEVQRQCAFGRPWISRELVLP